jgi:hypothetical protein
MKNKNITQSEQLPLAILVSGWSISETALPKMSRNLVGSTYGRFCIKFPQIRMKGERRSLM